MAKTPKLRWSVYVDADVQPNGPLPNFGDGDTPAEALANLRQRWEDGRDEYAAALATLEDATSVTMSL